MHPINTGIIGSSKAAGLEYLVGETAEGYKYTEIRWEGTVIERITHGYQESGSTIDTISVDIGDSGSVHFERSYAANIDSLIANSVTNYYSDFSSLPGFRVEKWNANGSFGADNSTESFLWTLTELEVNPPPGQIITFSTIQTGIYTNVNDADYFDISSTAITGSGSGAKFGMIFTVASGNSPETVYLYNNEAGTDYQVGDQVRIDFTSWPPTVQEHIIQIDSVTTI